ncbi:beta-galactosidase [Pseudonocardia sediminis]|uniref:Beta-galactosidase n=1 Tax=Pseudonocardia sediminis TaxID=1397368 RepID=A0A4Q7UQF4_PSEST|nr:beta-galactosidase [Pseudonocardia sediminis]RZT83776.1 beta-galactosidase [Pseudonocardia sediminis]
MSPRWLRGIPPGTRIEYGADYNPEQWPREVWRDDVELMRRAGVTIATVGVFSWTRLQPGPEEWDLAWLDEVMDLLHDGGIAVDLATATASPPAWLTTAHPEILPVDADGRTISPGGRQHWRPTSPVFRRHALALVERLARRYGDHPALVAWHVNNELGCHNVHDYSDDAAAAFRVWLRERHGDLATLNEAWGTAFWSQGYRDWDEILPPRRTAPGTAPNPGQSLDFARFSSDALRDHLRAERDLLRSITPDVPVTTNFMVMDNTRAMDYASWAGEVDIVSNDHYVHPEPLGRDELSFSANLTGGLAGGRPWWLMEHSTSAVNWQPVNHAKRDGELERDSLTHLAHGADAICFFQWRQSAAGAERFHSAMLPHAGAESTVFRTVTELGATLRRLAPVAGTPRTPAPVALLFDWPSWWATRQDFLPSSRLEYRREALAWYRAFLDAGVRVDVLPAGADLAGHRLAVAPMLHVLDLPDARRLAGWVEGGGHLVATYFSGVADSRAHVYLGGYPGALRDLLGIRIDEFAPLAEGETVELDAFGPGAVWTDRIDAVGPGVEVLASYASGEQQGRPAVTRRRVGAGAATWVSTQLGRDGLSSLVTALLPPGVGPELPAAVAGSVELVVRGPYRFLVNRTDAPVEVTLDGDVLHGRATADGVALPARGVAVLRRPPDEGRRR